MCFLWIEWTDFTIILTQIFLLLLYLWFTWLIPEKTRLSSEFLYFFFIYMLVSKERPVRVVVGNQLFLRGREVKATVFRTAHIVWLWFWVVRGQVKSNWGWRGFNSHSLSWTDRSSIHPKLKSWLGVECRKTLGSTARPGRETLIAQSF